MPDQQQQDQLPTEANSLDQLVKKVIGCAFAVHNSLGFGFLESVYEKALGIELAKSGVAVATQVPIQVHYRDQVVGDFVADMLIANVLIVELKSVTALSIPHEVQLVNYLTATRIDHGLLLNFGPQKVEIKRKFRKYQPAASGGQDQQNEQDVCGPQMSD